MIDAMRDYDSGGRAAQELALAERRIALESR